MEAKNLPGTGSLDIDFETGIPWSRGVDLTKDLLPVDSEGAFLSGLSAEERRAVSWALGLLAASAIKEHERVLNQLRKVACPHATPESRKFFLEEAIHSKAFERFLSLSAEALNLTLAELSDFLPQYDRRSLPGMLHALEAKLSGNAIWWTVATTEEESIKLYQKLLPQRGSTDPVFFQLNRLHFLEEARHSSFSYEMIRMKARGISRVFRRTSFLTSRVLQLIWLAGALRRFRRIHRYKNRHPLLATIAGIVDRMDTLSFPARMRILFHDLSYTKMMVRPESHSRLRRAIDSQDVFFVSFPEVP